MRVGLRTTCHKAYMLKVAVKPIAAGQIVKLVTDRWFVVGIGAWVGIGPSQDLVMLIHHTMFHKKVCMEILRIATPVKSALVLMFVIFVVVHENRSKGVGL